MHLFTVEDTFTITGRGLILVPGIKSGYLNRLGIGKHIKLIKPNGENIASYIREIEVMTKINNEFHPILLDKYLMKEDVPIGSEIHLNSDNDKNGPFRLTSPEIVAEIYYLTPEEGGRHSPIFTGYRGQFYYNNRDWDAVQQFINKEICSLGDIVKVYLQCASPQFHRNKIYNGKEFQIKEGNKTVGIGRVIEVIREDYKCQ